MNSASQAPPEQLDKLSEEIKNAVEMTEKIRNGIAITNVERLEQILELACSYHDVVDQKEIDLKSRVSKRDIPAANSHYADQMMNLIRVLADNQTRPNDPH